ncbi:hypothetical protein JCM9957A_15270 [Kineosporia succinea]
MLAGLALLPAPSASATTTSPVIRVVALGGGQVLTVEEDWLIGQDVPVRTARGEVRLLDADARDLSRGDETYDDVSVSGIYILTASGKDGFRVRAGAAGRPTRLLPAADDLEHIKQSGRYSLVGGAIYRTEQDGSVGRVSSTGTDDTDLFGEQAVWSDGRGRVWQQPLDGNDRLLVARDAAGPVAVWGRRVAWLGRDGRIRVRSGDERVRVVDAGPGTGRVGLSENVLWWTGDDGRLRVLNLADPRSVPRLTVLRPPYAVDSGFAAGTDTHGYLRVRALPFPRARPELLSSAQESSAARGKPWHGTLDFTKPVQRVRLFIHGQRVGQTVQGRGTVRVSWNGLRADGRPAAPDSCLHWRVEAFGTDGSGAAVDQEGSTSSGDSFLVTPVPRSGCAGAAQSRAQDLGRA